MQSIFCEVLVHASVERVFDVFADLPHAAERLSGIDELTVLTEGPIGIGTRFRETRTLMGRPCTEEMEITAFDPPAGYVVEAHSRGCRYRTEYQFSNDTDGVRVTCRFEGHAEGLAARLLMKLTGFLMKGFLKRMEAECREAVQKDMQELKAIAEDTMNVTENDGE